MKRSLRETVNSKEPSAEAPQRDTEELIKEYSRMSENELMRELMETTKRRKNEGSFDMKGVLEGVSLIEPMLNEEQKAKLRMILEKL